MTWRYIEGDNYDLDQLIEFKKFFEEDMIKAINEVINALKYEKYGLPNWRTELLRREMGVEESEKNLNTVNRAIRDITNDNI
tara:strand:- start:664 stop:909 length:246 start_codon:yes stop_codon:yes gene_type:complete